MALILLLMFLVVPVLEIYVIVQVGQEIGALPTVVLLLAESALGALLVKREGSRAWEALRVAVSTGRLPSRELADAGLVLVGGTLLLTPGFITDVVGFFLILPPTRPLARRALGWVAARQAGRVVVRRFGGPPGPWPGAGGPWPGAGGPGRGAGGPGRAGGPTGPGRGGGPTGPGATGDRVVPGEVVDDDRP